VSDHIEEISLPDGPLPENHRANMLERLAETRRNSHPELIATAEEGAAWMRHHLARDLIGIDDDTVMRVATAVAGVTTPLLIRQGVPLRAIALIQLMLDMAIHEPGPVAGGRTPADR
jgi:hypothetical protein